MTQEELDQLLSRENLERAARESIEDEKEISRKAQEVIDRRPNNAKVLSDHWEDVEFV